MMMSSERVIVSDKRTGEILSENTVEPARTYWNQYPEKTTLLTSNQAVRRFTCQL